MVSRHRSTVIGALALVSLASLMVGRASAQPNAAEGQPEDGQAQTSSERSGASDREESGSSRTLEEITVRAPRSLSAFRVQLNLAKDKVYDLFNELNSNDEFDIECSNEPQTGSRIPRRICRPQFRDDTSAQSAKAYLDALFHSGGNGEYALSQAQIGNSRAQHTHRLFEEEMRRLTREHPELRRAMLEFVILQHDYRDAQEGR